MFHKESQQFNKRQNLRLAIDDGEIDDAERRLHRRQFVEIIQNDQTLFAALQFDDDAHAMPVALVPNIADTLEALLVHEFSNFFDQTSLVYLIWNLGNDDDIAIFSLPLDRCSGAHPQLTAARLIGLPDAAAAMNDSCGGKIRTRD